MLESAEAALLRDVLAELQAINDRLGVMNAGQSSVQIATSTRGNDVTVKVYSGSPVTEAGNGAIDEYLRVRAEIERRLMGGGV